MQQDKSAEHGHKPYLKFVINDITHETHEQFIKGRQLKMIGNIPLHDLLYLKIREPWRDELIENDREVDLALPGIEHFFSKEVQREIIVNGTPKKWEREKISFKELIILEYGTYNDNPNWVYTVAYEDGPKENREGSMIKGSEVFVKNKMIFHATATDKS